MPAIDIYNIHRASLELAGGPNVMLAWSAGAKPNFEALTPNNVTPYATAQTDLRKGPWSWRCRPLRTRPTCLASWSLTIYDQKTWAFIYSPEQRPGLSSRDVDKMTSNADGSVTLYFGPKAPEGLEHNWIPTSGKAPYAMFRFYGPEDAFFDRAFKLADVELVE